MNKNYKPAGRRGRFQIKNYNIIFLASDTFGLPTLQKLFKQKFKISLVITSADKPVGRKQILTETPIAKYAQKSNLPILKTSNINAAKIIQIIKNIHPDLMILASFGQILSKVFLSICQNVNVHPSLLPAYRGSSPIQFQILGDENEVGITLMQMDEGLDTGPIYCQKKFRLSNLPPSFDEKGHFLLPSLDGRDRGRVKNITAQALFKYLSKKSAEFLMNSINNKLLSPNNLNPQAPSPNLSHQERGIEPSMHRDSYFVIPSSETQWLHNIELYRSGNKPTPRLLRIHGKIYPDKMSAEFIKRMICAFAYWPETYIEVKRRILEKYFGKLPNKDLIRVKIYDVAITNEKDAIFSKDGILTTNDELFSHQNNFYLKTRKGVLLLKKFQIEGKKL